MRRNYAVLVFQCPALTSEDDEAFQNAVRVVRETAHRCGLEDGTLVDAMNAMNEGRYEYSMPATDVDK